MPAWPGGPCPQCGEDMPPALIHCRTCRTLLNPELERDSVEIPSFVPLQEAESVVEITPVGLFVECTSCHQELKINRKYLGQRVQCKFCAADFRLDPNSPVVLNADSYATCPHCEESLRFASKYIGSKVACRFCQGKVHILPPE
jgi:hypothetical protein